MLRHVSFRLSSLLALLAILASAVLAPVPAQAEPASGVTPAVGLLWDFQRPEEHIYADLMGPRSLATASLELYAAFGGSHLYLFNDNGFDGITTDTIDPAWGVGLYTSLAVDPTNDFPRISYIDQFNNTLKYASRSASGWTIEKVDGLGGSYGHTSLALYTSDSTKYPGITYYAWDSALHKGILKYAYQVCAPICIWAKMVLDNSSSDFNGENSSLGYDLSERPVIAYSVTNRETIYHLKVASWNGTSWTYWLIDDGVTPDSIAMANSGNTFYISYAKRNGNYTDLRVASSTHGASGPWSIATVDNTAVGKATYTSIALNSSGQPSIAYGYNLSSTSERLKLASKVPSGGNCPGSGGFWNCDVAQPDPTARVMPANISLVFADDGVTPYIAYTNLVTLDGSYRLIIRSNPTTNTWFFYNPPLAAPDERGYTTSLALDPSGWAHISHTGYSYGLFFTEQTGASAWSTVQITDSVSRYNSSSLALDPPSNTPYIAYIRGSSLMAAHQVDSGGNCGPSNTWLCEIVSNANISTPYGFLSLALYNHTPYIAYHDYANKRLVLASYVGSGGTGCIGSTAWSCVALDTPISPETDIGYHISMVIGSTGQATIVYATKISTPTYKLEAIRGAITSLAQGTGITQVTVLNDIGSSSQGGFLSIANGDHPHASYYQSLPGAIGLGHAEYVGSGGTGCSSAAWKCELVVTTSETGRGPFPHQTSIAADAAGNVAISYAGSSPYFYTTLNVLRYVGSGGNAAGGRWYWQNLPGVGETGTDSSIKLDGRGLPRVSVYDTTTGHLRYAVSEFGVFIPIVKK